MEVKAMVEMIELLNPVASAAKEARTVAVKSFDTLEGKTVGILWSFLPWRGFELFAAKAKELIRQKYNPNEIIDFKAISAVSHSGPQTAEEKQKYTDTVINDVAKRADCVIVGAAF